MTAERRYQVFNHTDGVWASPFPMTLEEAEEYVKGFPGRYERQGYYRTASGGRIRAEDVELEVVECDRIWDLAGRFLRATRQKSRSFRRYLK